MAAKIRIISIGKVSESFIKEGEETYLQRFPREITVERIEIPTNKLPPSPESVARAAEGDELLKKLDPDEYFIALAERGKEYDSVTFAQYLQKLIENGSNKIAFGIGGAYGWDEKVLHKSRAVLSLSRLTFPRQLTRLILVEQLYRAVTIIKGHPYHK